MAALDVLKRLKFDIDELELTQPCTNSTENATHSNREGEGKSAGKVLLRGVTDFLSKKSTYSHDNYSRRHKQQDQGCLAVNYVPYNSLGSVRLDSLDLVEEMFACDLRTAVHSEKYKEKECSLSSKDEHLQQKKLNSVTIEDEHDDSEESDEPVMGASLHGGLSHMRLVLGSNDRRIYSQQFSKVDYWDALQREKQRMMYLKEMWSHPPSDGGHHPSKYLNPMVHTSSSKDCLLTKEARSFLHAKAQPASQADSEDVVSQTVDTLPKQGKNDSDVLSAKVTKKSTRNNSLYLALASKSFKRRPTHVYKRAKKMADEQSRLDNLINKLSSVCQLFNALTNIRNRDLRRKHPLPSEVVKHMMSTPNESFILRDNSPSSKNHHLPSHLHPAPSHMSKTDASALLSRPISNGFLKSNCHSNQMKTPLTHPTLPPIHHAFSPQPHHFRNVNFGRQQHKMAADDEYTLGWDDFLHLHQMWSAKPSQTKNSVTTSTHRQHTTPSPCHRPTKEVPMWHRPMKCQEHGLPTVNKAAPLPEEKILFSKKAFEDAKSKHSQSFQARLSEFERDTEEYFVQTLKELHLGPLVTTNLNQMRNRAHENITKMKMKEDNKPLWFLRLEREAKQLSQHSRSDKLQHLFKKLRQFDELNDSTVPHLKEKMCLIVMSLPAYLLAQEHMTDAVSFVLSHVLMTSSDFLSLWVAARQLPLPLRPCPQHGSNQPQLEITRNNLIIAN